jgi:hypothetical protein
MKKAVCTFNTYGQGHLTVYLDYSDAAGPATTGITFSLVGSNNQTYRFPFAGPVIMNSLFGLFNLTATDAHHPPTDFRAQTVDANDHPGPAIHFTAAYQQDSTGINMVCTSVTYTAPGPHPISQTLKFDLSPENAAELAAVVYWTSMNS